MPLFFTGSYLCFKIIKHKNMKAVATSFTNNIAGITGRVILYSYKVYVSLFSKRGAYYEMTTELPVKRELSC
jgi:hypothetical protein